MAKRLRINQDIRASKVRLIDDQGAQIGIIPFEKALEMAKKKELDLVEVSPMSNPPVCKLKDYGKFLYRQNKIDQKHKKMQKKNEIKGVRLSLKTEKHDLETKAKQARKFLENRDTLKVALIFKGREAAHADLAKEKMMIFANALSDIAKIELAPKKQGNTLMMILLPLNKVEQEAEEGENSENGKTDDKKSEK